MTDKTREKLEDIIVAILLSKTDIRKDKNGRTLHFVLKPRKIPVFIDYLERYNLHSQIVFNLSTLEGHVLPSLMLETILRSWVKNDQVQSVDPLSLRLNTYYMWMGLFAEKTPHSVAIPTDLDPSIQYTLSTLFHQQFNVPLTQGSMMQIKPFSPIMLQAIQTNRPIEESMELSYLLPNKEKDTIKQLVSQWEEERANYAY
ncbi:hypothetical protein ACFWGC_25985 [Cytobacillus pseudoceanisediminis]|uniref:hypothetical protein n=1 Tax=Cytobacillus pseudoceanisediminis TaxID=3051614 RepID=UPI0036607231